MARHDAMFGPQDVLGTIGQSLELIAGQRQLADGELRVELMRVESRWAWFASWLSNDAGDWPRRDSWAERALQLAREANDHDMTAWALLWQGRWAVVRRDLRRAIALADAARRTRGATEQTRRLCALKSAHAYALVDDVVSCERSLADAHGLRDGAAASERPAPWDEMGRQDGSVAFVLADEARCWISLRPRKAITTFEEALRLWPADQLADRGAHQARLARACAAAGEPDRAAVEGVKALHIAQTTKSHVTVRELTRLDHELAACDAPAVADFRDAFATL